MSEPCDRLITRITLRTRSSNGQAGPFPQPHAQGEVPSVHVVHFHGKPGDQVGPAEAHDGAAADIGMRGSGPSGRWHHKCGQKCGYAGRGMSISPVCVQHQRPLIRILRGVRLENDVKCRAERVLLSSLFYAHSFTGAGQDDQG